MSENSVKELPTTAPRSKAPHQVAAVIVTAAPNRPTQIQFHLAPGVDPMQVFIAIMEVCITHMSQVHTADRLAAEQAERRIVVPTLRLQKPV